MIKDITIGRYYQGDSVLHRLDPRVKIFLCALYMIAIFILSTAPALIATIAVVTFLAILSAVPPRVIMGTIRPILFLLFFILVLNALTIRTGNTLFAFSFIKITDTGMKTAVLMTLRLLLLVVGTSILLTLTTTPLLMADSLESLFGPLKKIHIPVHEMAMMMSIALRFVPTLVEETDKIMKAQQSRGADFTTGSIVSRLKNMVPVLVPLFLSAFRRADELAMAMEARCYRGGIGRTQMKALKVTGIDYVAGGVFLFMTAGLAAVYFLC